MEPSSASAAKGVPRKLGTEAREKRDRRNNGHMA